MTTAPNRKEPDTVTDDPIRPGGMTFAPEVYDELRAGGLSDDDIADAALDSQLWHSRLTRQQRRALQRELRWFRERQQGTPPTPREFAAKAPNLLRMVGLAFGETR